VRLQWLWLWLWLMAYLMLLLARQPTKLLLPDRRAFPPAVTADAIAIAIAIAVPITMDPSREKL